MTIFEMPFSIASRHPNAPADTTVTAWANARIDDAGGLTELLESVATDQAEVVIDTPSGGRVVLRRQGARDELAGADAASRSLTAAGLSAGEHQVLRLAADGLRGAAIAQRLGLPIDAVAALLASVRAKLGVRSTADAIATVRAAAHRQHDQGAGRITQADG